MNKQEQQQNEINGLHQLFESIEEEYKKGRIDDNGDYVLSDESHARILMLMEQ